MNDSYLLVLETLYFVDILGDEREAGVVAIFACLDEVTELEQILANYVANLR